MYNRKAPLIDVIMDKALKVFCVAASLAVIGGAIASQIN